MAYEDLTTFTETDPNSRLTPSPDTVAIDGLTQGEHGALSFDYGVDAFDGDFTIRTFTGQSPSASFGRVLHFALVNTPRTVWFGTSPVPGVVHPDDLAGLGVVHIVGGSGSIHHQALEAVTEGGVYTDSSTDGDYDDPRYYEHRRVEDPPGPNGAGYLYTDIYSNESRETLVDSLQLNLHNLVDFRYLYTVMGYGDGWTNRWWTGTMGKLEIVEVVALALARRGIGRGILRGIGRGL